MTLGGARERMIDTGAATLHVTELGEGPLVLLLQGLPDCGSDGSSKPRGVSASSGQALAVRFFGRP